MPKFEDISDSLRSKPREDDKPELEQKGPQTYLFIPTDGKDMKSEYPELGQVPEFSMLSNAELVFVWCMGNRTSPLMSVADRPKAWSLALEWSGLIPRLSANEIENFKKGIFPSKISTAINRMGFFIPSIRMRAKLMSEKMMSNLETLVDLSEEEKARMTLSEKTSYAGLVKTITNEMDDLIVSLENSYGVKEIKKKKGEQGTPVRTLMDEVMSRQ